MSKLILVKLTLVTLALLLLGWVPGVLPGVVAQEPSERERILAVIEKLGGTAALDEKHPARPIVAVDI